MENDVVVPGVGVGGLSDKYEIKILICYLLHSVRVPLTREQLSLIFQEDQLVNYFGFCDALKELIESRHLEVKVQGAEEVYLLNSLGIKTAERMSRSLPKSLRDNVVETAMRLICRLKLESENEVSIRPYQNGFMVSCIVHDIDFDMMKLELFAPDELQASRMKEKFLSDPASIYRKIVGIMIDSNESIE